MNPRTVEPHPSPVVGIPGGLVGTLFAVALLHVAPALGLPLVDVPQMLGRLVSNDAQSAHVVGTLAFFALGTFVLPFVVARLWPMLPGPAEGLGGALLKGVITGAALWVCGVWPAAQGLPSALWLLASDLGYGLALTLIIAMAHGIDPIGTLGWGGYHAAVTPDTTVRRP